MSTGMIGDLECPKCGKKSALSELDCRTREEWGLCESCDWGYQWTARRFAADLLEELHQVLSDSTPLDRWPLIKSILKSLLRECRGHGFTDDEEIVLLEVNTLPGMTPTSLFPDGARALGMSFPQLMDALVLSAYGRGS